MTETEILLTAVCVFLVAWCWRLHQSLVSHHNWITSLAAACKRLQGFANHQVTINSKTEEVQSTLEDVNTALKKIVDQAGRA